MADMVRAAGEKETLKGVIYPRITVIRDRPPRSDIDLADETGANVEDGSVVQKQARTGSSGKDLHFTSPDPRTTPLPERDRMLTSRSPRIHLFHTSVKIRLSVAGEVPAGTFIQFGDFIHVQQEGR